MCLILAMLRLFREDDKNEGKKGHVRGKVVYLAPYEAIVKNFEREWRGVLRAFSRSIITLTGNQTADL